MFCDEWAANVLYIVSGSHHCCMHTTFKMPKQMIIMNGWYLNYNKTNNNKYINQFLRKILFILSSIACSYRNSHSGWLSATLKIPSPRYEFAIANQYRV